MTEDLRNGIFNKKFIKKEDFKQDQPELLGISQIGKYKVIRLLGKGGLGDVYLAEDTALNRLVALKVLTRVGEHDIARFQREALLTAKLSHPNIVKIYEIAEHDNIHYISMQYIDGESLEKKNLTMRQKIEIIRQMAQALDHAHSLGIIHRDVKPANILLDKEARPFLSDFGISKQLSLSGARSSLSVSGMIIGTPSYMSPEQAAGEIDKVDYLSDVYSLGATLYYLLAQREPYYAASAIEIINKVMQGEFTEPRKINKKIPIELEAIILKAMERDKQKRYQSSFDFAQDLKFYLEGKPTMARPRSLISRVLRRLKRKNIAISISVTSFIILLVAGVIIYLKAIEYKRQAYEISEKLKDCEKKLNQFDSLLYMPEFDVTSKYHLLDEVVSVAGNLLTNEDAQIKSWAYYYIGGALFRKGRLEDAYNNLCKAINLLKDPSFYFMRAEIGFKIYYEKSRYLYRSDDLQEGEERYKSWKENALKDIEKYLGSNPDEKDWLTIYAQALVFYCEKKYLEAKDLLKDLIGKVTLEQSADILRMYAEVNLAQGNIEEAVKNYKKAAEIKRSDHRLYTGLGNIYLRKADHMSLTRDKTSIELFNNAIDEFSRALNVNSLSDVACIGRALSRLGLIRLISSEKALDDAIDDCTRAFKINPALALALCLRSYLYSLKGLMLHEYTQDIAGLMNASERDLESALKLAQDNEFVLEYCAFSLYIRGKLLFLHKKDPSKDFERAAEIFEKILDKHKECKKVAQHSFIKCSIILNAIGTIFNHKGAYLYSQDLDPSSDINKSIDFLTKALKINSKLLDSYITMATSYQTKAFYLLDHSTDPTEELEKSILYLKEALKINPEDDEIYSRIGTTYWLKLKHSINSGRRDDASARQAIENFTKAMDVLSQNTGDISKLVFLYEIRGHCYLMKGNKDNAISDWNKAIELAPHLKDKFLKLIQSANQTD